MIAATMANSGFNDFCQWVAILWLAVTLAAATRRR